MGAQIAPSGEHYAGRPSDTGYGGTLVNATGTFAATIPLDLPPARGGLPIPLQISYGARGVGAAGLGWDLPLSYVQHDKTLAHRRPASAAGTLPGLRERAYLSLFGQSVELVAQGGVWVARSGTLELMVRESAGSWLAYDGEGRTYTFTRPDSLGSTGLWLLKSVSVAGGASVELTYQTATLPLNGGVGLAINLLRIDYNTHPTAGCAKNEIALSYGPASTTPLSMSMLGDKVLVRENLLTFIDVESRATCATPFERLRRYKLQYPQQDRDPDTQLPRLTRVLMSGRQGTPAVNTNLPVASYSYGSATTNGKLRYQTTQTIDLPVGVADHQISSTDLDPSVTAPVSGIGYAMWQTLIDISGDGRPDLVFEKNNKLWVAYNRPAAGGKTTLGVGAQAVAQLSDATLTSGAISTQTDAQQRFAYGNANRNTVNVWRQEIDVNGDGRIDIVDAAEQADHWVVYLNTPGTPTGVKWVRRSFSVKTLRETLVSEGHSIAGNYVPLSRRATGVDIRGFECWQLNASNHWDWDPLGFGHPYCYGAANNTAVSPERTFVEWELDDLNGDGYPDFVFDSTPVDFQAIKPADPTYGSVAYDHGAGYLYKTPNPVTQPFAPASTNEIRASFNVLGVRFDTDVDPFSQSVNLLAAAPQDGVAEWVCTAPGSTTSAACGAQSEVAGLTDVNGDGLVDRVVGASSQAFLGAYVGTALTFSQVYLTLPGPLASQTSTQPAACGPGGNKKPQVNQTQGLRDLTGDGIPDYYDQGQKGRVWIGTGTGFAPPIDIVTSGAAFVFSHETERCDGTISHTDGGLYDLDGDGRPDVIGLGGNTLIVSQLVGGSAPGIPEAGRLTAMDNGYGAKTRIGYVSAKTFTDNPVPFPEIVVSSVATTGTHGLGGSLSGSRYAYGNAALVFDSALDRFNFPGYGRSVELRLYGAVSPSPALTLPAAGKPMGAATITDTWPLTAFSPALTKSQRWLRTQRVGRVRDLYTLRRTGDVDPWSMLSVDANDTRVVGVTHQEWDAKLYQLPPIPAENIFDCLDMVEPLDFAASVANSGNNAIDVCRAHGFAFGLSSASWYGGSPPPSDDNIQTRTQTLAVDDFGRSTNTEYENDIFRSDDDFCVENIFATPNGTFPRVLNALAARRVDACGKNTIYASESWTLDGLSAGDVSDGRVTSHSLDRRATDNGALLHNVHVFDATYDAAGNVSTVRTQRDAATRTVTFGYDLFGLVPTQTSLDATGVPSTSFSVAYDPISLQPLSSTDALQTQRGTVFDGFGRPVRSTVTPPGGQLGVVSLASYAGFGGAAPAGRRVTLKQFIDPVAPASATGAAGRTGIVFLDELGRDRGTELALGNDYANQVLSVGARLYDDAGRVVFEADPHPKSQNPATAYGTSYYFKNTGDPDCIIRGRGPQALSSVTDLATERFPACFQRSFGGHVDTVDVRDAASLQAGSPQAGVVRRIASTAVGRAIERSTLRNGVRLEDATFGYDHLGQQASMTRFLNPVAATSPVQWSWRLDSIGQTLQLTEPATAVRTFSYSDWGEPVETQWADGPANRELVRKYDALGRLILREARNNGIPDPATVNTYGYDVGVNVSPQVTPTFVQSQLARATSPTEQVTFSYDAYGRMNAQVFTDNQSGLYVEKESHHFDGSLGSLEFDLPDQNYAKELVKNGPREPVDFVSHAVAALKAIKAEAI